jgi:hypothetical protein
MKTLSALMLATALALATASTASAYSWQADKTSVKLRGILTFTPNEGSKQKPFKCLVVLDLKTKRTEITAVKFPKGDCEGVGFDDIPWRVNILTQNSGNIGGGSFASGDGVCVTIVTHFQDNGSGTWTLPVGGCIAGTMTSTPPVTIVP